MVQRSLCAGRLLRGGEAERKSRPAPLEMTLGEAGSDAAQRRRTGRATRGGGRPYHELHREQLPEEGEVVCAGGDKSGTCDYGLPLERDKLRSLASNAARCGQSCSVTAVNFNPSPLPGSLCRTIASVLIWPSWTRKSSLVFMPTGRGPGAAINKPPALRSWTRETSSLPLQRQ